MKILQIISGDLWAGAESMAYQLLRGLSKHSDIELSVILLNHGKLAKLCTEAGIKTYIIDEEAHSFSRILIKVIKTAIKIKPDIIHAHRYKENVIAAAIQPFCGMPKLISTQHGRAEADGQRGFTSRLRNWLNHACLNHRFHTAVAVSEDTRDYMSCQCGINKSKTITIHNGIDTTQYNLQSKPTQNYKTVIASAGRLFPVKNFLQMVEIAGKVCKYKDNVEFALAGDGPEKDAIIEKIESCGIQKQFRMLGNINAMTGFYRDIDVYINTSLHEGTPMTILEAMASGKPVLAYRTAGLKEIITDGYDGYTIPPGNPALFASKIIELLDRPDMLAAMGVNARNTITNKYSTDKMVLAYREAYKRLCT